MSMALPHTFPLADFLTYNYLYVADMPGVCYVNKRITIKLIIFIYLQYIHKIQRFVPIIIM